MHVIRADDDVSGSGRSPWAEWNLDG